MMTFRPLTLIGYTLQAIFPNYDEWTFPSYHSGESIVIIRGMRGNFVFSFRSLFR